MKRKINPISRKKYFKTIASFFFLNKRIFQTMSDYVKPFEATINIHLQS